MSTGQYRRRQEFYRAYSSVNSAGKPCQRPCICDSIQLADTGRKEWIPINKVRITVLKTTFDQALAAEYGANGLTACPMLQEGQVFYADYAKPAGLCDEAWKAIYQYAFALSHGAGETLFYYGDWISKPGVAICSCNDGLRPVIFKLEATDLPAEIDYTPVRAPQAHTPTE